MGWVIKNMRKKKSRWPGRPGRPKPPQRSKQQPKLVETAEALIKSVKFILPLVSHTLFCSSFSSSFFFLSLLIRQVVYHMHHCRNVRVCPADCTLNNYCPCSVMEKNVENNRSLCWIAICCTVLCTFASTNTCMNGLAPQKKHKLQPNYHLSTSRCVLGKASCLSFHEFDPCQRMKRRQMHQKSLASLDRM